MKFWDSSAVLSLVSTDKRSSGMLRLLREDSTILVWTMTPTECLSAIHASGHQAQVPAQSKLAEIVNRLRLLQNSWIEIHQVEWVKKRAERLLSVHGMSTAAALQLGAALVACEDRPDELPIVTFDPELARCASREGFQVIGNED
ncbi:MAG: hypothetical protein A2428_08735 [Bdellovibrionales bacterium RIFOXYC1_FULL_54_43]|nr:MAG: hypothetical protein A2428_08735 [Bdellovibrionales bacterium RIFOXYC1_FULL_54_43]OFZ81359.1 MAG: hypothetical protein A2603_08345 [Bdellovibrionales bacterium RIFOXYD1_FULL_55_31]